MSEIEIQFKECKECHKNLPLMTCFSIQNKKDAKKTYYKYKCMKCIRSKRKDYYAKYMKVYIKEKNVKTGKPVGRPVGRPKKKI